MSVDTTKLYKPKQRGEKLIAQCPACAEMGADSSSEHFVRYNDGRFGCIVDQTKEHRRRIAELVGDGNAKRALPPGSFVPKKPTTRAQRGSPDFPKLERPTIHELSEIARIRQLPAFPGCQLAADAGHLFTADIFDDGERVRGWIITDSARRNAQVRRIDGKPLSSVGAKAKTLRGSEASWPIGAADIRKKPIVAVTEGGGDFIAAYFISWWHSRQKEIAPVAMLGAGQRIHLEALPLFIGKRVLIFPHRDEAGQRANAVWTNQLRTAGAASIGSYDCSPEKDLNDLVRGCAAALEDDQ